MNNRRMFSNRIANSAKFLQMPAESQLLYFHMILRADDDGIVESYPLMKLLGMAPDNFKVLVGKGFIKQLNEDQVIIITDWLEHNKIRADRKVDSIYLSLLKEKYPELPIVEPKPRSDVEDNSKRLGGGQSTDGISQVKLSQVKSSKVNTNKINSDSKESPTIKRKDFTVPLEIYKEITDAYQKFKGIELKGAEFGQVKQAIKTMLYSGRTKEDILNFMEFMANNCEKKEFIWLKNWTILTIKKKMSEFLASKFGNTKDVYIPEACKAWIK